MNLKLTRLGAAIALVVVSFSASAKEEKAESIMNKDQIEGQAEEIKGKVKEATGVILDDKGMEVEGNVQKKVGKAQKGYGDLKQEIKKDN